MTEPKQVYKCLICGNITEVLHPGVGELVCCGKPMELQTAKTQDEGQEKHVPVIEKTGEGTVKVKIGSVPHPMEPEHYIEWIELQAGDKTCKRFLTAEDQPEAEFKVAEGAELSARVYCNMHGLWKSA